MCYKLKNIITSSLLILTFCLNAAGNIVPSDIKTIHTLNVAHPGKELAELPEILLFEHQNSDGLPDTFHTDVVSVYCTSDVCKIDTVTLYWNELGQYLYYKTAQTIELEKAGGEIFNEEDNQLLHEILQNKNSPFKSLRIDEIVTSDLAHGIDVDAYTGATAIEFEEGVSVEGAALTCYTLWHWAHGNLASTIRNITGDALSAADLNKRLKLDDPEQKIFALEQIIRLKLSGKETQEAILQQATNTNASIQKLILDFLEKTSAKYYFSSLHKLFESGNNKQRVQYLNSLIKSDKEAPDGYYNKLCEFLPELSTYQEVNLMLSLIETKNHSSSLIHEHALRLLKADVFIARRAYWYLSYQELNKDQQKTIDRFYKKNRDYL